MHNKLDQLKKMSTIVADSGDIEAIRAFSPQDCTTNPSLILKAAQEDKYTPLLYKVLTQPLLAKGTSKTNIAALVDQLSVAFGTELARIVPGFVSTEVDACLSFNTKAMVNKAKRLIAIYAENGVSAKRILIKLAATWEGIKAAEKLEREGIRCNMTLIFSVEQAMACADSGAYLISPFVGRITDWYKKTRGVAQFSVDEDPGVLSVRHIYQQLKKQHYPTIIMGASFRSTAQIEALAGCDRLTISPNLLNELYSQSGHVLRQLSPDMRADHPLSEISTTEPAFRWGMNDNAMATEKLAEGIRLFHQDYLKLIEFLGVFAEKHQIAL